MNWDQVEGNWKQFKGKAQQVWGDLTDDELDIIQGKRQELVGRLQKTYGYTKERAEQEADKWARELS
ncbi:MAG: CsbD family protein [Pseudomonadota bacterium]|nr:CsbD family protein [Pseudomonadota bacterium]